MERIEWTPEFAAIPEPAWCHHEKLNGTGYPRGIRGEQIPLRARMMTVADIFDALSAKRPYRDALPLETVFKILRKDAPHALDATCLDALEQSGVRCDHSSFDLQTLNERLRMAQRY